MKEVQLEKQVKSLILLSPYTQLDYFLGEDAKREMEKHYKTYTQMKEHNDTVPHEIEYIPFQAPFDGNEWWLQKEVPVSSLPEWKKIDGIELAKQIYTPTLVIFGTQDTWMSIEGVKMLYENIPGEKDKLELEDTHGMHKSHDKIIERMFKWFANN